ncbi:MAG TPA: hypothetical protein VMT76_11895 [Puia sp.]|nr:hypothetical protein [Puia sp.]
MKKAPLIFIILFTCFFLLTVNSKAQRVDHIDVSVNNPAYNGACPAKIIFKAVIHYSGAGTLQYQWVRSDGAHPPTMTIKLDGSGTRIVNTSWQLGKSYSGWEALKVISPGSFESSKAEFNMTCNGSAPQRTVGSPARKNIPNAPVQSTQAPVTNAHLQNPPKKINDTLRLNRRPNPHTPVQMQKKPLKPQVQSTGKTPNSNAQ